MMTRNTTLVAWGPVLAAMLFGCSFEGAAVEDGADAASRADALRIKAPNLQDWRGGERPVVTGFTPTHDPAACSGQDSSIAVFMRDSNGRYRASHIMRPEATATWHTWGANIGATKTFTTRPACVMRETSGSGGQGVVLVGKAADNQLYSATGRVPGPINGVAQAPLAETQWEAIGNTTNVLGGAALASSNTRIALAFNTSDNKLHVRTRSLPYSANVWQQKITAPALPAGATLEGAPAITYLYSGLNRFQIVARMMVGSVYKLYTIYFSGTSFVSATGGSPSWTLVELNSTTSVDSDPSLEYTTQLGAATLYFRSSNRLMQTSGLGNTIPLGSIEELAIDNAGSPSFSYGSGPAAVGQSRLEFGRHNVLARTSDGKIWAFESGQDMDLIP
jgi:hypothetical protein